MESKAIMGLTDSLIIARAALTETSNGQTHIFDLCSVERNNDHINVISIQV